jgi:hypothetical protein
MPAKGHYEMEGSYDGATREKNSSAQLPTLLQKC